MVVGEPVSISVDGGSAWAARKADPELRPPLRTRRSIRMKEDRSLNKLIEEMASLEPLCRLKKAAGARRAHAPTPARLNGQKPAFLPNTTPRAAPDADRRKRPDNIATHAQRPVWPFPAAAYLQPAGDSTRIIDWQERKDDAKAGQPNGPRVRRQRRGPRRQPNTHALAVVDIQNHSPLLCTDHLAARGARLSPRSSRLRDGPDFLLTAQNPRCSRLAHGSPDYLNETQAPTTISPSAR